MQHEKIKEVGNMKEQVRNVKNVSIRPNICLIGVLGSKNIQNGGEAIFKEILAKNIPELQRTTLILSSIQESHPDIPVGPILSFTEHRLDLGNSKRSFEAKFYGKDGG